MNLVSPRRATFLSKLRRNFLLRVHPDHFSNVVSNKIDNSVLVQKQTQVVTALTCRMSQSDVKQYLGTYNSSDEKRRSNGSSTQFFDRSEFYLFNKNRELQQFELQWNLPLEQVLKDMVDILRVISKNNKADNVVFQDEDETDGIFKLAVECLKNDDVFRGSYENTTRGSMASSYYNRSSSSKKNRNTGEDNNMENINNCSHDYHYWSFSNDSMWSNNRSTFTSYYDRGRNLEVFLREGLDRKEIERLQSHRRKAQEVARAVKVIFKFEAVDVSGVSWASESLEKTFQSLFQLYQEHQNKFHVQSFYPFRLEFSSDEFEDEVCCYGGRINLNPAATPIQWLRVFLSVTRNSVENLQRNRKSLKDNVSYIEKIFQIKLMRGLSCPTREFHRFCEQFTSQLMYYEQLLHQEKDSQGISFEFAMTIIRQYVPKVFIEGWGVLRKGSVTEDGSIRVGSDVRHDRLRNIINSLGYDAYIKSQIHESNKSTCNDLIQKVKNTYSLKSIKTQSNKGHVSIEQMIECLDRLQARSNDEIVYGALHRNSLRIGSRGNMCHISDDGSITIPYNWK